MDANEYTSRLDRWYCDGSSHNFSESISAQETVENTGTVLDTITITARKRAESVHDVPISVTVKESGDLAVGTIDTGADLARETPNFNFVDFAGPGGNYATMRGIGPLGSPLNSLDNTIGFSVDGVPTSSFGFSPTLMDVERVEVLRGPQGTMFGRNALGVRSTSSTSRQMERASSG